MYLAVEAALIIGNTLATGNNLTIGNTRREDSGGPLECLEVQHAQMKVRSATATSYTTWGLSGCFSRQTSKCKV
jgi:hypothetical protein